MARAIELQEGVDLKVDSNDRALGLARVNDDDFQVFLDRRGGELDIPEWAIDIDGLAFA